MEHSDYFLSPIGNIKITATHQAITSVRIVDSVQVEVTSPNPIIKECIRQLKEYFLYQRKIFNLPLSFAGTSFQQEAWATLLKIPYGTTINYTQQALSLGGSNKARAVGAANSKNQHWIIVPCHRVVGKSGSLTGYAGGIWRKEWLLKHEQHVVMK
ncbi:MAG: methylated-DNA--[protein]-cysteine S-methyltransferase [Bacteroidales bacterium]